MAKKLRTTVHVTNPDTNVTEVFGPDRDDGEVPGWAAETIVNPDVWAVDAPPRTGKGSGRDVWAEFATANGAYVADDATKEEIVADLEARGVIGPEE